MPKILPTICVLFFAAAFCASAQTGKPAPAKPAAGQVAAGKKDFEARCSACHGMDGSGKTAIAETLGGVPDLHSKQVQMLTNAKIKMVIIEGTDKMPAVPDVSDQEAANLIAFIRSLARK